jgi:DNA-binding NtrC family response regulator
MHEGSGYGANVLIVDDEEAVLRTFQLTLQADGIGRVVTESDSSKTLQRIQDESPAVVLLDLTMPGLSGRDLLPLIRTRFPHVSVVIVTGNAELETAVACMKAGASDYLVKPIDRGKLASTVRTAMQVQELRRENAALARHLFTRTLEHAEVFDEIITRDPRMLSLFQYVEAVAFSTHPVLVTGETGTGKELFARAIHQASGRSGEMVTVNAAGLDDTMFSDLLFGHRKGAFTGADQPLRGLVERAAAGTLFLDEIGDLNAASQVKLLRLSESGEYYPLGSDQPRRSDARLVIATNRNLEAAVAHGGFRSDLYFRLATHHVAVPPLRERRQDIPLLVDKFLKDAALELTKPAPKYPNELLVRLRGYDYPGNVRELRSLILDAVGRNRGGDLTIVLPGEAALGDESAESPQPAVDFAGALPTIQQAIRMLVGEALNRSGGNQTAAAHLLGISQQALSRRLKDADLKNAEKKEEDTE